MSGDALVDVLDAVQDGDGDDLSRFRLWLFRRDRYFLVDALVRPVVVVEIDVFIEDLVQTRFTENGYAIQAFAAEGSDYTVYSSGSSWPLCVTLINAMKPFYHELSLIPMNGSFRPMNGPCRP